MLFSCSEVAITRIIGTSKTTINFGQQSRVSHLWWTYGRETSVQLWVPKALPPPPLVRSANLKNNYSPKEHNCKVADYSP